jgi:transcriptional regulator with XRE-family HTH domain
MEEEGKQITLGAYLRSERERAGLSLRGLAHKARIDHGYIGRLEHGAKSHPSAQVLRRIASALDIAPNDLLTLGDAPPELPDTRTYFRRKLGVTKDEANILAGLIKDYQAKKRKEIA